MNRKMNALLEAARDRLDEINQASFGDLAESSAKVVGKTKAGKLYRLPNGVHIDVTPRTNKRTGAKVYTVWIATATGKPAAPLSIQDTDDEQSAIKQAAAVIKRVSGR